MYEGALYIRTQTRTEMAVTLSLYNIWLSQLSNYNDLLIISKRYSNKHRLLCMLYGVTNDFTSCITKETSFDVLNYACCLFDLIYSSTTTKSTV